MRNNNGNVGNTFRVTNHKYFENQHLITYRLVMSDPFSLLIKCLVFHINT